MIYELKIQTIGRIKENMNVANKYFLLYENNLYDM